MFHVCIFFFHLGRLAAKVAEDIVEKCWGGSNVICGWGYGRADKCLGSGESYIVGGWG